MATIRANTIFTNVALTDTRATSGSAELVFGEAFELLHGKVRAKYGYQLWIINMLHALPGHQTGYRNDCAVIFSFDQSWLRPPVTQQVGSGSRVPRERADRHPMRHQRSAGRRG